MHYSKISQLQIHARIVFTKVTNMSEMSFFKFFKSSKIMKENVDVIPHLVQ